MAEQGDNADIVVIEDDLGIARFLSDLLSLDGYRVALFPDGTALDAVSAAAPRLILLDLMLPAPDGAEICRLLRADARTRATPIVFMTAAAPRAIKQRLLGCQYDGLLHKPFDIDDVLDIADRYARERAILPAADAALGNGGH
jgi:chemosensory pili system protein ChpA (sensor histidine kinase/response regulator)